MEAVKIHQDIQSHQSLGIHWGTFKLTYEPYTSPRSDTMREGELAGLKPGEFTVVNLGETVQGKQGQEVPLITESASESKQ